MSKIDPKVKVDYVERYLRGDGSLYSLSKELGIRTSSIHEWVRNYESMGAESFKSDKLKIYSKELKISAVEDYLNKQGSLGDICKKYGIKSKTNLRRWIKKYNSYEKIKASSTGGSLIMTKGRETTFEERIEIVKYCIEHDRNYVQTAKEYNISYRQARNYTKKYDENGTEGLRDRRGKRKAKEDMTEIERLRAENRLLRAEKKQAEMELSFLKKLEEIERRRG